MFEQFLREPRIQLTEVCDQSYNKELVQMKPVNLLYVVRVRDHNCETFIWNKCLSKFHKLSLIF